MQIEAVCFSIKVVVHSWRWWEVLFWTLLAAPSLCCRRHEGPMLGMTGASTQEGFPRLFMSNLWHSDLTLHWGRGPHDPPSPPHVTPP